MISPTILGESDSGTPPHLTLREVFLLLWGIGLYVVLRIHLLPSNPVDTLSFSHDSAYLAMGAGNLQNGRGWVLDSIWLVFTAPDTLPTPLANSNPLYPLASILLSGILGADLIRSGLIVSALANGMLVLSLYALLRVYARPLYSVLGACSGVLFPVLFLDSQIFLTDALFTFMIVTSLASLARIQEGKEIPLPSILAGVFWALAWLTRSQAVLMLPATIVFFVLRLGVKKSILPVLAFSTAATITISPWIYAQHEMFGSTIKSESAFYLVQDIESAQFSGSEPTEYYWHSTQKPRPLAETITSNPIWFIGHLTKGILLVIRNFFSFWALHTPIGAFLFLTMLAAAVVPAIKLKRWRNFIPELAFVSLYAGALIVVFGVRGSTFEIRYGDTISVLVGALILPLALTTAFSARRSVRRSVLCGIAAYWLLLVPQRIWKNSELVGTPVPAKLQYRESVQGLASLSAETKSIISGNKPYYFTLFSGIPSLSIPYSDDTYLSAYMGKYGAKYLYLTQEEIAFWKPLWNGGTMLPPFLVLERSLDDGSILFRRVLE